MNALSGEALSLLSRVRWRWTLALCPSMSGELWNIMATDTVSMFMIFLSVEREDSVYHYGDQ
jgi:hypothetical protein